jgi:tetratricopeptide (TPR) repeat protein
VLLEQGRLEEAEAHLKHLLRAAPEDARVRLGLARLALARSEWREALGHLAHAVEDPHARKAAHTLAADARSRLGEDGEARRELRQAAESPEDEPWLDPFVVEVERMQVGVRVRLAEADALLRRGRPADAVRLLEEIVRDGPDSAAAWLRLGQALLVLGEHEAARRALEQAVERQPDSVEAWFRLGCARYFLGGHREAADAFRRALHLKPDHTLAHYDLGQCLKQLGDADGAAEEFRQTLHCQPDYAPARAGLRSLRQ